MQQDGVAGVSGRGLVRTRNCPGGAEDLQVGDDESQEDEGQQKDLRGRREDTLISISEVIKTGNENKTWNTVNRIHLCSTWTTTLWALWYGVVYTLRG